MNDGGVLGCGKVEWCTIVGRLIQVEIHEKKYGYEYKF